MKKGKILLFLGIVLFLLSFTLPIAAEEYGGFSYNVSNGEVTIYSSSINLQGDLIIPEEIHGYPVTKIGQFAFSHRERITSIKLPSSLVSIDSYAFNGCTSLESVTLPDNTEISLGEGAFKDCTSLKSCVFPKGLTEIPPEAFFNCTSLKNVIIPENIVTVGRSAFYGCSSVTEIYIPKSVTEIGYVAFSGCDSVEKITIPFVGSSLSGGFNSSFGEIFGGANNSFVPKSLKEVTILGGYEIPKEAFEDCEFIEKIYISASISKIGEKAFYSCYSLKEIVVDEKSTAYQSIGNCLIERGTKRLLLACPTSIIPDDTTAETICSYAFSNCINIKKIVVPNSIQKIEKDAFFGCMQLEEISLPFVGEKASNTTHTNFGYIFGAVDTTSHTPTSLKTVVVTGECSVAQDAFASCQNITSFTATSDIKNVAEFAFFSCTGLEVVRFEGTLENLGQSAFLNCTSLKEILLPDSIKNIGYGIFENCSNVKILCKKDSVAEQYAIENNIPYELIEATPDSDYVSDTETTLESVHLPESESESESGSESGSEHETAPNDKKNGCTGSFNGIAFIIVACVVSAMIVLEKRKPCNLHDFMPY